MGSRAASRWQLVISTVVLLFTAVWVGRQWPERGFWYDETVNAYFAEHSLDEVWQWCTEIDNQVPLDFMLRNLWGQVAGTTEFSLRVYSYLFALLSAAGVMALGKRVGGTASAGWIATLAYVLTQSFLYAAFEVRSYSLALALFAWSGVILWALWMQYAGTARTLGWRYVRLLAIFWMLALALLYTHYTGVIALAAYGVFVVLDALYHQTFRRWSVLFHLGTGLVIGYIPWLIALNGRDIRAGTAYAARVNPSQAIETYIKFYAHGQRIVTENTPPYAELSGLLILVFIVCIVLVNRRRVVAWRGFVFALAMVVIPLLGLLTMVYTVQAKLSGRHGWPIWIGAALMFAVGITALDRLHKLRWAAVVSILVIIWLPARANLQPTYNSYLREGVAYINTYAKPGDVLVLRDGTLFAAADYYDVSIPWIGLPEQKLTNVAHFLFVDEAFDDLDRLIKRHNARRVWVLTWQGQIMDPQDLVDGMLEFIGDPQPLEQAFGFGDVSIQLYDLRDDPAVLRDYTTDLGPIVETPYGGPVFYGGQVLRSTHASHGGIILLHTWWRRGLNVMPGMRVSVRLYDHAGNFYTQIDQPPVGPSFGQENWPEDRLVLSRFLLWVPPEIPSGVAEVKLLIYHVHNRFDPITVPIGTVIIQD